MQVLNSGTKRGATNSISCFFNIVKHETVSVIQKNLALCWNNKNEKINNKNYKLK